MGRGMSDISYMLRVGRFGAANPRKMSDIPAGFAAFALAEMTFNISCFSTLLACFSLISMALPVFKGSVH